MSAFDLANHYHFHNIHDHDHDHDCADEHDDYERGDHAHDADDDHAMASENHHGLHTCSRFGSRAVHENVCN